MFLKKILYRLKVLFQKIFLGKNLYEFLGAWGYVDKGDKNYSFETAKFYKNKDTLYIIGYYYGILESNIKFPYDYVLVKEYYDLVIYKKVYTFSLKDIYKLLSYRGYFIDPYKPWKGICHIEIEFVYNYYHQNPSFYNDFMFFFNSNKYPMISKYVYKFHFDVINVFFRFVYSK